MARENEGHGLAARGDDAGRMRVDGHSLRDDVVARGDELVASFYFDDADAACADLVGVFEVAQRRDGDARGACRLEDGGVFGDGQRLTVDGERYHARVLPPLKAP